MKNKITMTFLTIIFCYLGLSSSIFGQSCADLKNKTYIAFGETVWDNQAGDRTLQGAMAFKITFDSEGKTGKARFMTAYFVNADSAVHQIYNFKCLINTKGEPYFDLTVEKTKSSAGTFSVKIFDKGSKLWVKSDTPKRDTPFWMLELPAKP